MLTSALDAARTIAERKFSIDTRPIVANGIVTAKPDSAPRKSSKILSSKL